MTIMNSDDDNFNKDVVNSDKKVLVDFWAPWCGPCKQIAPLLEKLSEENKDVSIVKINIDENPEKATEFGIRSIPTLLVFNSGKKEKEHVGALSFSQLEKLIG